MNQKPLKNPQSFDEPLCVDSTLDFFFLDNDENTIDKKSEIIFVQQARAICSGCKHIEDCAEWAIRKEKWGFWGGLTSRERITIRRRRKIRVEEVELPHRR